MNLKSQLLLKTYYIHVMPSFINRFGSYAYPDPSMLLAFGPQNASSNGF